VHLFLLEFSYQFLDGVLCVLVEMILTYGGGEVEGTEVVQYVVNGRCEGGIGVEQHLLFGGNGFGGVVDTEGCEGVRFDGIALTIRA